MKALAIFFPFHTLQYFEIPFSILKVPLLQKKKCFHYKDNDS